MWERTQLSLSSPLSHRFMSLMWLINVSVTPGLTGGLN